MLRQHCSLKFPRELLLRETARTHQAAGASRLRTGAELEAAPSRAKAPSGTCPHSPAYPDTASWPARPSNWPSHATEKTGNGATRSREEKTHWSGIWCCSWKSPDGRRGSCRFKCGLLRRHGSRTQPTGTARRSSALVPKNVLDGLRILMILWQTQSRRRSHGCRDGFSGTVRSGTVRDATRCGKSQDERRCGRLAWSRYRQLRVGSGCVESWKIGQQPSWADSAGSGQCVGDSHRRCRGRQAPQPVPDAEAGPAEPAAHATTAHPPRNSRHAGWTRRGVRGGGEAQVGD